ncbi:unnamed protein product [Adineta ricciae]|uniref:Uncharacterized protein n=1 Tax=Adineta ricciae TaxID=249248 RepID=A0A815PN91_ADIRI|nr:unnamed protein product [Adineta ricciae]
MKTTPFDSKFNSASHDDTFIYGTNFGKKFLANTPIRIFRIKELFEKMGNTPSLEHPLDAENFNLVQCDKCHCHVTIPKSGFGNTCACGNYVVNTNRK